MRFTHDGLRGLSIFAIGLVCAALLWAPAPQAQQRIRMQVDPGSVPCGAAKQTAIIDSVTAALNEVYVFPDVAKEMEKLLRRKLRAGDYEKTDNMTTFTSTLTEDLREVSKDRHLGVRFVDDQTLAQAAEEDVDPSEFERRRWAEYKQNNFQFKKIEVLPGNIGYLRFDGFVEAYFAGATAIAALNFVGYCDAVIIDLRYNGGGSPSLIQLITSYFVDEVTHLNSFYVRKEDTMNQFWTQAYVPGPRMVDTDLYVLTSNRTFSGAEEFTYNMKNMERATIIGETTGGGAHPIERRAFPSLNVAMSLPFGRAVNPITETNWEGAGIDPHIAVPADKALDTAYLEALKKLREPEDLDEEKRFALDWAVAGLEAKVAATTVDARTLSSYAGTYCPRTLTLEGDALFYQRADRPKFRMIPMTETLFRFEELEYFRLEVVVDGTGRPVKLVGHYDNGHRDESPRSTGR